MNVLIDFFNSEQLTDDAMYYSEMHGFLTSLAIQSGELKQQQILNEILSDISISQPIQDALNALENDIKQSLLNGDFPDTSSADDDEESLSLWTSGFMQGVFLQENIWFADHPEEVAELTLPILSCSELLNDELDDISQNDELLDDMAERIPDCIIDLYLLFNTPEGT